MTDSNPMTSAERTELSKLIRLRARVAKSDIDARQAALVADAEAQLAAIYDSRHEAWADITTQVTQLVQKADAEIAARCRDLGIPEKLRPGINTVWYGRGENADRQRRAELRKVAETRLAANTKAAKVEVDRSAADLLTQLAAGALGSAEAKAFLDRLPTVDELLPRLDIPRLDASHQAGAA